MSTRLPGRLSRLLAGLVLFGVSVALMVRADLGLASWDVLHQGLAERTGLPLGQVVNLVAVVVLLLWIPLRQRPGFGTLANAVVVGVTADATLAVLPPVTPSPAGSACWSPASCSTGSPRPSTSVRASGPGRATD